jgi:hypothetical protein
MSRVFSLSVMFSSSPLSQAASVVTLPSALFRLAALACRTESPHHTGKEDIFRQVSGTSDASKTQLGLTSSYATGSGCGSGATRVPRRQIQ